MPVSTASASACSRSATRSFAVSRACTTRTARGRHLARPATRHNLKYWTDGEWLGFGCGAHGTVDGVRTKNVSGIDDYIERLVTGQPVASEVRRMDAAERLGDALFTGLRLTRGIDLDAVQ